MIFIDESGAHLALTRSYARAPRNKRVYDSVPIQRWPNINIIGALGIEGILASQSVQGSVGGEMFKEFLKEELSPVLKVGHIVLMDNLSGHKVEGVRELIKERGASLIYLPPYSPDFNPIENCWSKGKAYLRKIKPRSVKELYDGIEEALATISRSNAEGWFRHCGYKAPSTVRVLI